MCNGLKRCCYLLCCCCCICFRKCCGGKRRKNKKKTRTRSGRVAPSSGVEEERTEVVESQPESTVCELQPEQEPMAVVNPPKPERKIVQKPAPKPEPVSPPSPPVPKRRASEPVVRKDHYSSPVVDVDADPCLEDRIVVKGRSSSYTVKRYRSNVYNPHEISKILKKVGDEDRPEVKTIMEIPERSRFSRKASKSNLRKGPKQAYDCLLNEPPEDYDPYSRRRDCIDEGEPERRDYIPYVKQCLPKNVCGEERSPECEDVVDDECVLSDPCELERRQRSIYEDVCDPGANQGYEDSRNECDTGRRQRFTTCEDTVCYSRGRNRKYGESRNECSTQRTDVCEDIYDSGAPRSIRSDKGSRTIVCEADARSRTSRYSDSRVGPSVERYSKSDEGRRTTVCEEDARSRTSRYSDSRGGPPVERYSDSRGGPSVERYSKSDEGRRTTVCEEDARSRTSRYSDSRGGPPVERYSDSRGGPSVERYSESNEARRTTVCDEDARSKTPRYSDSRAGPSVQRYSTIDEARRATVFDEDTRSGTLRHSDSRGSYRSPAIEEFRQIRHTETKIEYGTLNTEKPNVERKRSTDKISVSFDFEDDSRGSRASSGTLPERRSIRASIKDSGRGYQRPPLTPYDSQKVFTSGRSISEDQLLSKKSSKSIMDIKETQEPIYPKRNMEKTMSNDSIRKTYSSKRAPEKTTTNAPTVQKTLTAKEQIPEDSQKNSKRTKSDDSVGKFSDEKKKNTKDKKNKKTKSDEPDVGRAAESKKKLSVFSKKKNSKKSKSDDSDVGGMTYAKKTVHEVTTIQKTTKVTDRTIADDLTQRDDNRMPEKGAPVEAVVRKNSYANLEKTSADLKKSEYSSSESLDDEECEPLTEKTKKSDCPSWPGPSCLKPGEKPKVSYVDRKAMRTPDGECPRWVTRTEGLGVIRSAKDPCENINYDTKKRDPLVPATTPTAPTDLPITEE